MTARALLAASVATGALIATPAAWAKQRVTCSSGVPVVRDGRLSIIGVRHPRAFDLYACLGRRRPVAIGDDTAQVISFDGSRYVGVLSIRTGGEGPADASYYVGDIRARRDVTFVDSVDSFDEIDPFRVTAAGALVRDDYGIQIVRPGFSGDARLIPPKGRGNELAYVGSTIYWLDEQDAAAARAVGTPPATPENRVYDLRRLSAYALTHVRGRCAGLRGRIVAASPHVRVVAGAHGGRRACALGKTWARAPGPGELRIVADRWLLSRTATAATVIDARNGAIVTQLAGLTGETAIAGSTLAGDGTFAWLERSGRLLAQRPRTAAPAVLAEASAAPTAIASSDSTIYWTAGGVAARWAR